VFVCWAKVGKAELIANPIRATAKRIFIVFSWSFARSSPDDLLRDFSGSRNLHVARGQREYLVQRPLSDIRMDASIYSASMRTFACACR
jgi:hypothetical protein